MVLQQRRSKHLISHEHVTTFTVENGETTAPAQRRKGPSVTKDGAIGRKIQHFKTKKGLPVRLALYGTLFPVLEPQYSGTRSGSYEIHGL